MPFSPGGAFRRSASASPKDALPTSSGCARSSIPHHSRAAHKRNSPRVSPRAIRCLSIRGLVPVFALALVALTGVVRPRLGLVARLVLGCGPRFLTVGPCRLTCRPGRFEGLLDLCVVARVLRVS